MSPSKRTLGSSALRTLVTMFASSRAVSGTPANMARPSRGMAHTNVRSEYHQRHIIVSGRPQALARLRQRRRRGVNKLSVGGELAVDLGADRPARRLELDDTRAQLLELLRVPLVRWPRQSVRQLAGADKGTAAFRRRRDRRVCVEAAARAALASERRSTARPRKISANWNASATRSSDGVAEYTSLRNPTYVPRMNARRRSCATRAPISSVASCLRSVSSGMAARSSGSAAYSPVAAKGSSEAHDTGSRPVSLTAQLRAVLQRLLEHLRGQHRAPASQKCDAEVGMAQKATMRFGIQRWGDRELVVNRQCLRPPLQTNQGEGYEPARSRRARAHGSEDGLAVRPAVSASAYRPCSSRISPSSTVVSAGNIACRP